MYGSLLREKSGLLSAFLTNYCYTVAYVSLKVTSCSAVNANVRFNAFNLPVSNEFDDIYFNNENGLAESRYVFLQHNDLPQRWQTHSHNTFRIAETGFGTGLNFLASWAMFIEHAPTSMRMHFTSFEKYPRS